MIKLIILTLLIITINCKRTTLSTRYNNAHFDLEKVLSSGGLQGNSALDGTAQEQWKLQPLDHFNPQNDGTCNQRYFINDEFFTLNGPVFIYIGGEGRLRESSVLGGHHYQMAKVHKALIVGVEHRFYGESVCNHDLSTENLQYLNSQQALADLASVYYTLVEKYGLNVKNTVVTFGGSYPGNLASWMRLKYPHITRGSIASSAPVLAQVDFEGYNNVVANSYSMPLVGGSQQCHNTMRDGFNMLRAKLQSESNWNMLSQKFNICPKPFNSASSADRQSIADTLSEELKGIVQYNHDTSSALNNIRSLCSDLSNYTNDPLSGLAYIAEQVGSGDCIAADASGDLKQIMDTTFTGYGAIRQWYYQTCSEFGYYQSCNNGTACIFGQGSMPVTNDYNNCRQAFGLSAESVDKGTEFSNQYYGARKPHSSSVFFVNGDVDPWHSISLTPKYDKGGAKYDRQSQLANGGSHCQDMSNSDFGNPSLQKTRMMIERQVSDWIQFP